MFKKLFNYLILLALIYLVFVHNSEKFSEVEESKKKKVKKVAEENNTDVNSLIDSVMEEEVFSKPITEEEAAEGLAKNESSVVSRIYNMFNSNDDDDSTPAEVEGVVEAEENLAMPETNVEEYIDEEEEETPEETSEEKPKTKVKRDRKCMETPKYRGKRSKSSKKDQDMNIYKPKSARLAHLQKLDDTVPKSIKKVFDEKIANFKKTNKLSKQEKQRIQGCFNIQNNESNNKFSVFEAESESPYDMDINANDVHFENYSLI